MRKDTHVLAQGEHRWTGYSLLEDNLKDRFLNTLELVAIPRKTHFPSILEEPEPRVKVSWLSSLADSFPAEASSQLAHLSLFPR